MAADHAKTGRAAIHLIDLLDMIDLADPLFLPEKAALVGELRFCVLG